jgi:DNA-binding CsgD family transcriptional regulator
MLTSAVTRPDHLCTVTPDPLPTAKMDRRTDPTLVDASDATLGRVPDCQPMEPLGAGDLTRILNLVHALGDVGDPDEFLDVSLNGVMDLVPCTVATMNEVVPSADRVVVWTRPASFEFPAGAFETLARLAGDHPLIAHIATTGDGSAHRISDFWTQEQFHHTELYHQVYRPIGIEYQMALGFPVPRPTVLGLAMNRDDRDFSDRDLAAMNTVRPYLVQWWRTVQDRLRLQSLVDAADDGLSTMDSGVLVLCDPPEELTRGVLTTLYRYFGRPARTSPFPSRVEHWLQEQQARHHQDALVLPRPLSSRLDGRRAVLRYLPARGRHPGAVFVSEHAVAGEPASLATLGLTPREAEIVAQITTGASNAEVARHLHVASGTVKRHLENVYRKLGIHGRGQLTAFVVETLGAAGTTGGDHRAP